jgi:16S rRNA (adenine1518-N6/adenine1519-N6)-dimethyltransferase
MQKLGQHFLKNTAVLEKIVAALALTDGDRVIEIGPGHGELTIPLVATARKNSGAVVCIEKDRSLVPALTELSEKEGGGILSIIEGDALKLLPEVAGRFAATEASHTAGAGDLSHYKIVGNIPYYITGKLLRVISELEHKPTRTVLLIQKEVAERICAAPPDMNRLAASVQFWADARIVAQVPRHDFSPPPEVDSAVVVLESKSTAQKSEVRGAHTTTSIDSALYYYRAVRAIFAQPRKTLLNNLSASTGGTMTKGIIIEELKKLGIDSASRPQDLGIKQIVAIAQAHLWG